ncbi:PilN domain-containing protein [Nguyenibacter sp. L1]|uniref:PilN domain-containing protein n=1 Tax=Nguyenibacter sp. L1 TaxID=3049350 RepID=UPI002B46EED6|nr:PilN domain-containing protein [Nguyenibacter sp. L1]WRH88868.1 PilN domain-containing protein [Nguyenibacter sp. L1]
MTAIGMAVRDMFAWWWRQVRDLVPGRARLARLSSRPVLVAAWDGASLALFLDRNGGLAPLGAYGPSDAGDTDETGDADARAACRAALDALAGRDRPAETVLRLPPGMVMQREVTLPAATESGLDSVLAYEMDRLTPFPAGAILYSHDIIRRDAELNQLRIMLSVVPRASVAPAVQMLERIGLQPDRLEDAARAVRIPLKARRASGLKDARVAAAAGIALLPALLVAALFWRQSAERAALSARIAALRPAAQQAALLRRQVEDRQAGVTVIAGARRQWGDPLAVLAVTTQVLPDDSFLTDLILRQGQLIISGQSSEATGLIQALSRDPAFRNPSFVAPVTRVSGQNASLFSIRADVGR